MAKITLNDLTSNYGSQALHNANNDTIEDNLNNKVLYRDNPDGEPNSMQQELDMNSNRIINMADGVNNTDAVSVSQLNALVAGTGNVSNVIQARESQLGSQAVARVFTLVGIVYALGVNTLTVYRNGQRLEKSIDYLESSASTVTLTFDPNANDRFVFITNALSTSVAGTTDAITHTEDSSTYNLATYLQNRHVVNLKDFGTDADAFTNALSAAMGGVLYVSEGAYDLTALTTRTVLTDDLVIEGVGDESVLTFPTGIGALELANYNLTIRNLKIVNGRRLIRTHSTTTSTGVKLKLENVTIDGTNVVFQHYDEATAALKEVSLIGCHSDGAQNFLLYESSAQSVDNTKVLGCTFLNDIQEVLVCTNRTNSVGSYQIANNFFYNLNNSVEGASDNDCHFIRCAGEKATITGNVFHTMSLASALVVTDDSEAIRPQCDQVVISGNAFIDCWFEEGAIAAKTSSDVTIKNNLFHISDAYRATHSSRTHNGIETAGNTSSISGNVFRGINGTVLDVSGATVANRSNFSNNWIVDCAAGRLFDFNSSFGDWVLSNNVVMGSSVPDYIIDTEFGGDSSSVVELIGNKFEFDTSFSVGVVNRNGITLRILDNDIYSKTDSNALLTINSSTDVNRLESRGNRIRGVYGFIANTTAFTYNSILIDDVYEVDIPNTDTSTKTLLSLDIPNNMNIRKAVDITATSDSGVGFSVTDKAYSSNGTTLTQAGSDIVNATSALTSVTLTDIVSGNDTTTSIRNQSSDTVKFESKLRVNIS